MSNHEEQEELDRVKERRDNLTEQRLKREKQKEQYLELKAEQRNDTKSMRNWHIKRWWGWRWKPEMESYEAQVNRSDALWDADVQEINQELEKIEDELQDLKDQEERLNENIADLKKKNTGDFWEDVLEGVGLISAESEVKDNVERVKMIRTELLQAVKETGIADFYQAAQMIFHHQTSKVLLKETTQKSSQVAARMNEFASQVRQLMLDDQWHSAGRSLVHSESRAPEAISNAQEFAKTSPSLSATDRPI